MSTYRRACTLADLADGKPHPVTIDDIEIVLVRIAERVYALDDRCSHADIPLSLGRVQGDRIKCQAHGAEFDLETGSALVAPAFASVTTYPIRIEDGEVYVDVG